MNFKISKNVIFKKMRKNKLQLEFQVFGGFFKSAGPVYYELHFNLI